MESRGRSDLADRFEVAVWLNGIDPQALRVELYADGAQGAPPVREPLWRERDSPDGVGSVYAGSVPASRPASDYTPRLMPLAEGIAVPLEESLIKWQR
jgi:starch phosphorylase